MSNKTLYITRTAVLLALTLVFQMLRIVIQPIVGPGHVFIVGSLVNLALIVAAGRIGLTAGIIISIATPIVAFFQGHIPAIPAIVLLVAAGNIILVSTFYIIKKRNIYAGVIAGAILKSAILFSGINLIFTLIEVKPAVAAALAFGFGWPQLVTALIGGYLAIIVLKALEKTIKN